MRSTRVSRARSAGRGPSLAPELYALARGPVRPAKYARKAVLASRGLAEAGEELAVRGLKVGIRANKAGCLDQCEHGPTVVIYPEAVWYGGVQPEDVPEIIESHMIKGEPVERLRLAEECLNTPQCAHKSGREAKQAE